MLHIDDIHRRVCRGFEEEDLGVRLDRLFPRVVVASVDDRRLDPETRAEVIDEPAARAEGGLCSDDMVARRQLAEQRRGHRGHAGRLRAACLGAFHQRDPLFEHRHGRVLQARIGHALFLARETRRNFLGAVIGVARGQEERFRRLAMLAAPCPAAHRLRCRMPVSGLAAIETRRLLHFLIRSKPKQPHCPVPLFPYCPQIRAAAPVRQRFRDRRLDLRRARLVTARMAQQHRERQDHRQRIGDAFARNVGALPWIGS